MAQKLTANEIDQIIERDRIVVAKCLSPATKALHGKFVSKIDKLTGEKVYSFCPFKKGVDLPFSTAQNYVLGSTAEAASDVAKALKLGRKGLKRP
jgi:hypothetical protein